MSQAAQSYRVLIAAFPGLILICSLTIIDAEPSYSNISLYASIQNSTGESWSYSKSSNIIFVKSPPVYVLN